MAGPAVAPAWSAKLVITLARGLPGTREIHRRTVKALGLRKVNHTVIRDNTPTIRGMINQVLHYSCFTLPHRLIYPSPPKMLFSLRS